jgi:hypothetical protein
MVAASAREEARRWERNLVWTEERLDRLDRLVRAMGYLISGDTLPLGGGIRTRDPHLGNK